MKILAELWYIIVHGSFFHFGFTLCIEYDIFSTHDGIVIVTMSESEHQIFKLICPSLLIVHISTSYFSKFWLYPFGPFIP